MMKKLHLLVGILLLAALFTGGCSRQAEPKAAAPAEIFVSAAASMTDAMKEIAALYQKEHGNVKITYNFGSSGALQAQIQQGAPADIFISAAQKQMNALQEKNLIVTDSRRDFVVNKVVLIAGKDSSSAIASFADVTKAKRIALGEPKGVPVGQYSAEIFSKLGIAEKIQDKVVYGSDVRQVLAWVEQGEVEVGVVYATDAAISQKIKVICEAPEGSHKPVIYPIALTAGSKSAEAKEFMKFLGTQPVKDILTKYGFSVK